VIAVGGTQLALSGSKYSETIWDDSGSGCADPSEVGGSGIPKPSWQHDPDCTYRTVGDVSGEAGCSPGVATYSSFYGGWSGVCGTSVPTPFIAGVVALAGNAGKMEGGKTFWKLNNRKLKKYIYDITSGSNGACGGEYLCTAGTEQFGQYSGPGGWGSPKGIEGF
jgi:subtilase family serine protease